jgi:hypothetical protein
MVSRATFPQRLAPQGFNVWSQIPVDVGTRENLYFSAFDDTGTTVGNEHSVMLNQGVDAFVTL